MSDENPNRKQRVITPGRREDGRVSAEFVVKVGGPGQALSANAEDVSENGMFILSDDDVHLGEDVEVSFALPDGSSIRALGEVRWIREANIFRDEERGFGIQFKEMSPAQREAIAAWIARERLPAASRR